MPWTDAIEQEYTEMLSGVIADAIGLADEDTMAGVLARALIKHYARILENGSYEDLKIVPEHNTYITGSERLVLFLMRVACCLYAERSGIFPWKLRDKTVSQLRPLLNLDYQNLMRRRSRYFFHQVWDVEPGKRMVESLTSYGMLIILAACGLVDHVPTNEHDMICFLIQKMRDSGWGHKGAGWDDYDGYPDHGYGVYDYEIVREVKRSGCHTTSDYIVDLLRSFNIASHRGRDPEHLWGHCYIHFGSIDMWFTHGDNVYDAHFGSIPVEFAFKSDHWMRTNAFEATHVEHLLAALFESAFWWCLLLGEHDIPRWDVRYLYYHNQLRNTLETLHEGIDWSQVGDVPDPIPSVFDDTMIDLLMEWVAFKLG